MKKIRALILAAGYGTRLKTIGNNLPKGLITFGNTCLVQHVISELHNNNISEAAIITNEKYYAKYKSWLDCGSYKCILLNDKTRSADERLGALGDLKFAIDQLGWQKENILVVPSDTYFSFSLKPFLNTIAKHPDDFSSIVRKMDIEEIRNRLGCAILSTKKLITKFVEKPAEPPTNYGSIPFYYYPAKIHKLLAKYAAEGNSMDAPGNIIPWLIKNKIPVRASIVSENTLDVGTMVEIEKLRSITT
jgi:glucose-1-phosphate thymidylyltransferase